MKNSFLFILGTLCALFLGACVSKQNVTYESSSNGSVTELKFDDSGLVSVVHTNDISSSILNHDAVSIFNGAKAVRKYEIESGRINADFQSKKLLDCALTTAENQGNMVLVQQIVDYSQGNGIVFKTETIVNRGTAVKAPVIIPQLVEISYKGWETLQPHQYPLWGEYIIYFYPQLGNLVAAQIAHNVNFAHSLLQPALLAETSLVLDKLQGKDVPEIFTAKKVMDEAIEMAIFMRDRDSLVKISEYYSKTSFKTSEIEKDLQREILVLNQTRGGYNEAKIRSLSYTEIEADEYGTRGRVLTGRDALAKKVLDSYNRR